MRVSTELDLEHGLTVLRAAALECGWWGEEVGEGLRLLASQAATNSSELRRIRKHLSARLKVMSCGNLT